jgi:hypothetical protein
MSIEEIMKEMAQKRAAKQQELQTILKNGGLLEWALDLHAQGKELKMTWDGGNDSGWVDFLIDDATPEEGIDADNAEILRDMCDSELDYGSWAGDFSANGEAIFNPEEKSFIGADYYSEDDTISQNCELRIEIPGNVWFDSVEIMIKEQEIEVEVDLIVRNGFKTELHTITEKILTESITSQIDTIVDDFMKHSGNEYRSMWEEINLSRADFTQETEGGKFVKVIEEIGIGIYNTEEKDICITIDPEL